MIVDVATFSRRSRYQIIFEPSQCPLYFAYGHLEPMPSSSKLVELHSTLNDRVMGVLANLALMNC